ILKRLQPFVQKKFDSHTKFSLSYFIFFNINKLLSSIEFLHFLELQIVTINQINTPFKVNSNELPDCRNNTFANRYKAKALVKVFFVLKKPKNEAFNKINKYNTNTIIPPFRINCKYPVSMTVL